MILFYLRSTLIGIRSQQLCSFQPKAWKHFYQSNRHKHHFRRFQSDMNFTFAKVIGSKKTRTNVYQLTAKGMVECWHRSPKASLMYDETTDSVQKVSTVLLLLRTVLENDVGASSTEPHFWTSLRVYDKIFERCRLSTRPIFFPNKHLEIMHAFQLTPAAQYEKKTLFNIEKSSRGHPCYRQSGQG